MNEISLKPIGVIHSPFKEPKGTPVQTTRGEGVCGTVEIFSEYAEGLRDLEGFSQVFLIYLFHLVEETRLKVKPHSDTVLRGVFATRAPSRPNHIGLSIVRLLEIEGNVLHIQDLDIVEGAPLLDIKPYIPAVDARASERIGWLEGKAHKFSCTEPNEGLA
jgi:tRNA-Thr(GGU) m(6)t(6)A37 methyltransferase TsaA